MKTVYSPPFARRGGCADQVPNKFRRRRGGWSISIKLRFLSTAPSAPSADAAHSILRSRPPRLAKAGTNACFAVGAVLNPKPGQREVDANNHRGCGQQPEPN